MTDQPSTTPERQGPPPDDVPPLPPTPSQTVGPFFGYALPYERGGELRPPWAPGALTLHGTVSDGAGTPVPDALIELWQADAAGTTPARPGSLRRDGATFTGFGRAATDAAGAYRFSTLRPGAARDAGAADQDPATHRDAAPHFLLTVFARGLLHHLVTRVYLPDEPAANAADPLLASLDEERGATLVAVAEDERTLRFDIRLQGEDETVFLDVR